MSIGTKFKLKSPVSIVLLIELPSTNTRIFCPDFPGTCPLKRMSVLKSCPPVPLRYIPGTALTASTISCAPLFSISSAVITVTFLGVSKTLIPKFSVEITVSSSFVLATVVVSFAKADVAKIAKSKKDIFFIFSS